MKNCLPFFKRRIEVRASDPQVLTEEQRSRWSSLITYISSGNYSRIQYILREEPELMYKKGDINLSFSSNRAFLPNASLFQLMLWTLDTDRLGRLMLDCIPEDRFYPEFKPILSQQFAAVMERVLSHDEYYRPQSESDRPRHVNVDAGFSEINEEYFESKKQYRNCIENILTAPVTTATPGFLDKLIEEEFSKGPSLFYRITPR